METNPNYYILRDYVRTTDYWVSRDCQKKLGWCTWKFRAITPVIHGNCSSDTL